MAVKTVFVYVYVLDGFNFIDKVFLFWLFCLFTFSFLFSVGFFIFTW